VGAPTRQSFVISATGPRRLASETEWCSSFPMVNRTLFDRFRKLIYKQTGIWLGNSKTALLCGRLAHRLRVLGMDTLAEYYSLVSEPDQQQERAFMIDAITTNETHFFREKAHFAFLARSIFPIWRRQAQAGRRPRKIRIWSAGCSSGEEAYSLAMMLAKSFPLAEGWDPRILGTDISHRVLATAREAVYDISKSPTIPEDFLRKYMLKGSASQEGTMKIGREIRDLVDFEFLNLNHRPYPISEPFDAIFCRNVLIYFDAASKTRVVEGLLEHLLPGGLLFSGHAESLCGVNSRLQSVLPTVYALRVQDSIALELRIASSS
jgi:chemotaxis protein methyltransferase CheR